MVGEFIEIDSGKKSDRPLARAIDACRKHKARPVIAKLDRLSRNLAFVATLMDLGVEFVAVDNPHANKLTIDILAAVAEHEREAISERTRPPWRPLRQRGRRLGTRATPPAPWSACPWPARPRRLSLRAMFLRSFAFAADGGRFSELPPRSASSVDRPHRQTSS